MIEEHKVKYIGVRKRLRGLTALAQYDPETEKLKVQFDALKLAPLCYGWHEFPKSNFEFIYKISGAL